MARGLVSSQDAGYIRGRRGPNARLTLRTKLLATGAILLGFTAAISALSITTISRAVERGTTIYDDGVVPLTNLGEAQAAFANLDRRLEGLLLARTLTGIDAAAV